MVRYYGLYTNAHRGKVRKSEEAAHPLVIISEECPKIPRLGWAEIRRKVYEIDLSDVPGARARCTSLPSSRVIPWWTGLSAISS